MNIKKGQFLSPLGNAATSSTRRAPPAIEQIMVCERGLHVRLQQPGLRHALAVGDARDRRARSCSMPRTPCSCRAARARASGGQREFVPVLARAAVGAGISGLFTGNAS